MFEIELNENYEDNFRYRNVEKREIKKEMVQRAAMRNRSALNIIGTSPISTGRRQPGASSRNQQ